MSITVVTTLYCEHEGCKEKFASLENDRAIPRNVRASAKHHKWARVGGKDFCPDHKPIWKKVLVPAAPYERN